MTDSRRVFFPLRSNAGWFQEVDLRSELEDRLKEAVLLYDHILVEDGTYQAHVLASGSSDNWTPPGMVPDAHRRISVPDDTTPGTPFTLAFGPSDRPLSNSDVVLHGTTTTRYKIDYFEMLEGISCEDEGPIRRVIVSDARMPSELKSRIGQAVFADKSRFRGVEQPSFLRDLKIKAVNRDLAVATEIGAAVVFGPGHADLMARKALSISGAEPRHDQTVLRELFKLAVPDFRRLSLAEVIELRKERGWTTFRTAMAEFTETIQGDPSALLDPARLRELVASLLSAELLKELDRLHHGEGELGLSLGLGVLGLVPGVSEAATAIGLGKALRDKVVRERTWYSFIHSLRTASAK